jgi:hypothetical protein
VIDFRLYRLAFAPTLAAIAILLFSLQPGPEGLSPLSAPGSFDQRRAASTAREIVATAPSREAGSEGDDAVADLVRERFEAIKAGETTEETFDDGMRNIVLTLPGETPGTVVVMASRDSAEGPGAASSAAATAGLLELASDIAAGGHAKSIVFVSTDGGSRGSAGARYFAEHYPARSSVQAAVVLTAPGHVGPSQPYLVNSSTDDHSSSIQLVETADRAIADQIRADGPSAAAAGVRPRLDGLFGELARLAIPSGLGDQAPLIEHGIPAVAISSAGERPLAAADDGPDDFSGTVLARFGRAALDTVLSADSAPGPLHGGPGAYLTLGGSLVPGWVLAILALTLLFPAALAAVDGLARAGRAQQPVGSAVRWSASLALPPLAALVLFLLLALVGILPRPAFPFDPGRHGVGVRAILAAVVVLGVIVTGLRVLHAARAPSFVPGEVLAPALGILAVPALLLVWVANPYLALLLVPLAHVWLGQTPRSPHRRAPLTLVLLALALVPVVAAVVHTARALSLGASVPWTLMLMVGDGQIDLLAALGTAVLAGYLLGVVALVRGPWTAFLSGE